ncbi:hypothetical protein NQ317_015132, partial [Molorchus minor]
SELCESKLNRLFAPKHHCNVGEVLCNTTKFYPEKEIKKILGRNRRKFEPLSGPVIEPGDLVQMPQIKNSLDEYQEVNMCRTRTVTVVPKTGFDVDMKLRYIVNVEGFQQALTYETCLDANQDCFGSDLLPFDYKTLCKQTYNIVRLVSLSEAGKLEYGRFTVPSNCVCSYKKERLF